MSHDLPFEWRSIAERGVQSADVVIALDKLADTTHSSIACLILIPFDEFMLECLKKRFHRCVVVTVARPTHTLVGSIALQQFACGVTGILCSSIAVEEETRCRSPASS